MSSDVIIAELVDPTNEVVEAVLAPNRGITRPMRAFVVTGSRLVWRWTSQTVEWCFGLVSMIVGLSILATVPLLQFVSLGYLLELSARVGRSGKLRHGFQDVKNWGRFGGAVLAIWLLLLPLRLMADFHYSALLLDNSQRATEIQLAMLVYGTFLLAHIPFACFRGGRFRHFAWPAPWSFGKQLLQVGFLATYTLARDRFCDGMSRLELPKYFWLGIRGFVVALIWIAVPITIMVAATQLPETAALFFSFIGGVSLAVVLLYVPFLQANFAVDNKLRSGFDVRRVRQQFSRAPIAWWFALLITLSMALPLYILKAELIPREAAWLPSIVFVVSILPARIFVGWTLYRAEKRTEPRHFLFRWSSRFMAVPVVLFYVLIVYFTQYVSWYGSFSLYEQHAFMLPVPFVGL